MRWVVLCAVSRSTCTAGDAFGRSRHSRLLTSSVIVLCIPICRCDPSHRTSSAIQQYPPNNIISYGPLYHNLSSYMSPLLWCLLQAGVPLFVSDRVPNQKKMLMSSASQTKMCVFVDVALLLLVFLQVSCVTRLVHQKGIHLIKHAAWRTCERGGQFVLLGSAPDPRVQVRH